MSISKTALHLLFFLLMPGLALAASKPPKLAIVVIDVQKSFISNAANPNMDQVLANTRQIFQQSAATKTPFYITYEASMTGDHDIPADLKRLLPADQNTYIKTSYGATGQKKFSADLKNSGATHVVVIGSETDVCVMQTVLGLREQGYEVKLQKDAVFSSDPNVSPALRRMEAAGVELVDMNQVQKLMEGKAPLSEPTLPSGQLRLQPYKKEKANVAFLISLPSEKELADSDDCAKKEKLARLSQLLVLSEWFQTPTFVMGQDGKAMDIAASLKSQLSPAAQKVLKRKHWKSFSDFPKNQYDQVVVAGLNKNLDSAYEKLGPDRQIYHLEDTILSFNKSGDQTPLHQTPITYKSLYREMTYSVEIKEFPSKSWIAKDDQYYDLLTEPEQLPVIPEKCRQANPTSTRANAPVTPARK